MDHQASHRPRPSQGKLKLEDLKEDDVMPNARQKGVDMRIGIDKYSLALKRQVDQIILVAGDADFVPAAKLARREGVDFVLDPMWQAIPAGLNEHIDGLRTTCARAKRPVQLHLPEAQAGVVGAAAAGAAVATSGGANVTK